MVRLIVASWRGVNAAAALGRMTATLFIVFPVLLVETRQSGWLRQRVARKSLLLGQRSHQGFEPSGSHKSALSIFCGWQTSKRQHDRMCCVYYALVYCAGSLP